METHLAMEENNVSPHPLGVTALKNIRTGYFSMLQRHELTLRLREGFGDFNLYPTGEM